MKAIARSLRITSKKINLIAALVRQKNVVEALGILKFTPKKGSKLLYKVVQSALANAENNFKQERASLYIKEIVVTEAPTMKRSVPISRGRANPILKRNAHVTVILGVRDENGEVEKKVTSREKPSQKNEAATKSSSVESSDSPVKTKSRKSKSDKKESKKESPAPKKKTVKK